MNELCSVEQVVTCCIAPSIAPPLPRKPAGVKRTHLAKEVCGKTTNEAIWLITALEQLTSP